MQKEAYLLELSRYVVLNPVRANLVDNPVDWKWSNYLTVIGAAPEAAWLDSEWLLSQFGSDRQTAVAAYCRFIKTGMRRWLGLIYRVLIL